MALSNIEAIYIKATYTTTTSEVVLNEVSMDTAESHFTGKPRAFEVEQCVCPEEYTGLSCENCSPGFTRNFEAGLYLGNCERCSCNGNSNDCDSETGVCNVSIIIGQISNEFNFRSCRIAKITLPVTNAMNVNTVI